MFKQARDMIGQRGYDYKFLCNEIATVISLGYRMHFPLISQVDYHLSSYKSRVPCKV